MPTNITPCESRIQPAQRAAIIEKAVELVKDLLEADADELFTMYHRAGLNAASDKLPKQTIAIAITLQPEDSGTSVGVTMRAGFAMKDSAEATIEATQDMFAEKGERA